MPCTVCKVENCGRELYPGCGITFHRMPKNPEERMKWMKAVPGITTNSVICGLHFADEDYYSPVRCRLKRGAVPSVFPTANGEVEHIKLSRYQKYMITINGKRRPGMKTVDEMNADMSEVIEPTKHEYGMSEVVIQPTENGYEVETLDQQDDNMPVDQQDNNIPVDQQDNNIPVDQQDNNMLVDQTNQDFDVETAISTRTPISLPAASPIPVPIATTSPSSPPPQKSVPITSQSLLLRDLDSNIDKSTNSLSKLAPVPSLKPTPNPPLTLILNPLPKSLSKRKPIPPVTLSLNAVPSSPPPSPPYFPSDFKPLKIIKPGPPGPPFKEVGCQTGHYTSPGELRLRRQVKIMRHKLNSREERLQSLKIRLKEMCEEQRKNQIFVINLDS